MKQKAIQIYETVGSLLEVESQVVISTEKPKVSFLKKALELLQPKNESIGKIETKTKIEDLKQDDPKSEVSEFKPKYPFTNLSDEKLDKAFNDWETDAQEEFLKTSFQHSDNSFTEDSTYIETIENYDQETNSLEDVYRKKIENYLSLFEVTKDIIASRTFEEFFENIVYSVIGQIGVESAVVFSNYSNANQGFWKVVDYDGVDIEENWFLEPTDKLINLLDSENYIIPARNLLNKNLSEREVEILERVNTSIVASIRTYDELLGVMLLGKPMNTKDYTPEDLEFVQIIGEIGGTYLLRLKDILSNS
ncbi:MAG: hypothetical protein H7A23_08630 [Leptospiraceae bacterium]|nr:hypothetical protein [Leptospiraceae bacterium]MCP5494610.1 hypothetical protein [Leptospiraceae bacterium]